MSTLDLSAAVAHNAKHLGLGVLPLRTQQRIAALLADHQAERGLEPDGAYDRATEAALNDLLQQLAPGQSLGAPPTPQLPGADRFTAAQVVSRALAQAELCARPGSTERYRMGGGAPYTAAHAFAVDGTCDCTGLVAYCQGYRRGSYNSDAIVDDVWRRVGGRIAMDDDGRITARPGPRRLYEPVDPDDLRPGDVIVWAGPDKDGDGRREAAGHGVVVVEVAPGVVFRVGDWADGVDIVHTRWQRRAARRTDATICDRGQAIAVRCKRVRYG